MFDVAGVGWMGEGGRTRLKEEKAVARRIGKVDFGVSHFHSAQKLIIVF